MKVVQTIDIPPEEQKMEDEEKEREEEEYCFQFLIKDARFSMIRPMM